MEIMVLKAAQAILLFSIISCTQFRSGFFMKVKEGDSLRKLSKNFNISRYDLEIENKGKSFFPGEWVFIPTKKGILPQIISASLGRSLTGHKEFLWPVPSSTKVSSAFGKRWGKQHKGLDIAAQSGAHIWATNHGVVVYSGNELGGYGNLIVLAHRGGYFSVYGHNKENFVSKGQVVKKGEVIGRVGSTGKSTGPHLHFEIRREGLPINPIKFISYSR
jgi:murein DD-endopeptidase MepM/ murein hydrolase activator NlpD